MNKKATAIGKMGIDNWNAKKNIGGRNGSLQRKGGSIDKYQW